MITNFWGALSQKQRKMTFREITNQDSKIFFRRWGSLDFENKGNFWINCVCVKTFASWHTHKRALHHGIPTKRYWHHGLNMCDGTIVNKLCIYTLVWDICIIRNCICIFVKKHLYHNQKSRLASRFACIHRKIDI